MPTDCSCGRPYENETGVKLCERNGHGDGRNDLTSRFRFNHVREFNISLVCADCLSPLKYYTREDGLSLEINTLPHVCQVAEKN